VGIAARAALERNLAAQRHLAELLARIDQARERNRSIQALLHHHHHHHHQYQQHQHQQYQLDQQQYPLGHRFADRLLNVDDPERDLDDSAEREASLGPLATAAALPSSPSSAAAALPQQQQQVRRCCPLLARSLTHGTGSRRR
jgi:hypothetical protein